MTFLAMPCERCLLWGPAMPSLISFSCCHTQQPSYWFSQEVPWVALQIPWPQDSPRLLSFAWEGASMCLRLWLFLGWPSQETQTPSFVPPQSHFRGCLTCSQHPLNIMCLTCQCALRDIVSIKFAIYIFMFDIIEEWMLLWKLNLWLSWAAVTLLKCNVIFDASSWGFIK